MVMMPVDGDRLVVGVALFYGVFWFVNNEFCFIMYLNPDEGLFTMSSSVLPYCYFYFPWWIIS